jgi:hypothetical protein
LFWFWRGSLKLLSLAGSNFDPPDLNLPSS